MDYICSKSEEKVYNVSTRFHEKAIMWILKNVKDNTFLEVIMLSITTYIGKTQHQKFSADLKTVNKSDSCIELHHIQYIFEGHNIKSSQGRQSAQLVLHVNDNTSFKPPMM